MAATLGWIVEVSTKIIGSWVFAGVGVDLLVDRFNGSVVGEGCEDNVGLGGEVLDRCGDPGAVLTEKVGFVDRAIPDGKVGSLREEVGVEVFGHPISHFSDADPADSETLRAVGGSGRIVEGHFCIFIFV